MSGPHVQLSGWGNYPQKCTELSLLESRQPPFSLPDAACIARGSGRSYGDSALAKHTLSTQQLKHMIAFDETSGKLTAEAGVTLLDILSCFVPRGYFLGVVPGTQFVSLGGAIASDVHGKNHHIDGCFSEFVCEIELLTASGEIKYCSREQNSELFYFTCGGMGLTGIILSATIQLKKIQSSGIDQTTYRGHDLSHTLELFSQHMDATYSVAWLDCLAKPQALGRSLVMTGEHSQQPELVAGKLGRLTVPCYSPAWLLNRYSIKAFNTLYYQRIRNDVQHSHCHYQPFFFPLDGITHWNRLYGKPGFVQYQFVVPLSEGKVALQRILKAIKDANTGSFLSVLKRFGSANQSPLSFPMEGLTLALDFKHTANNLKLLDYCDEIVCHHGGRLYLTKDARMSPTTLATGYSKLDQFKAWREKSTAIKTFNSYQSQRLGL
jgi:FAD/FMN-containing dehydrogenase